MKLTVILPLSGLSMLLLAGCGSSSETSAESSSPKSTTTATQNSPATKATPDQIAMLKAAVGEKKKKNSGE